MIVNLQRFVNRELPYWERLEEKLARLDRQPDAFMDIKEIEELNYLYTRVSGDLARLSSFSSSQELKTYLEALVAKAYAAIYDTRKNRRKLRIVPFFTTGFPRVFRKHIRAFYAATLVLALGMLFGAGLLAFDPATKSTLMPFSHLKGDPSKRVEMEEAEGEESHARTPKTAFSSYLMTHNIRVSIKALAFGITFGIGTIIILFANGISLGAVLTDYILAGESLFLTGWLLPHGSIEIPAVLIAGQAGLVLASAMIGRNQGHLPMKERIQVIMDDLAALILGCAALLVWAGLVESFLSQTHAPVIPYWVKILFGATELVMLILYLGYAGKHGEKQEKTGTGKKATP